MTEEQALALARLVASVDGLELGERVRCAQSSRRGRSSERVWSIGSELYGPGPSLGFEIDDRTCAVLSKAYVGFGARARAEFGGEPHSSRFSVLERELFVPATPTLVFQFFADAANVAAISAPALELMTRLPHRLETGSVLDWQIRSGKRVRPWQLRTTDSIVGQRLDESQVLGPFQHFRHLLLFCAAGSGSLLRERLEYRVPGGTWGQLIGESLLGVKRSLEDGLELRYAAVSRHFGQPWPNGV